MFTGIVETVGRVERLVERPGALRLSIRAPEVIDGLAVGGSVAVNGVCLTAVEIEGGRFSVEAVPETLRCTNLGELAEGSDVNLERPMAAAGRFEGHVVQGHVDAVARVLDVVPEGDGKRIRIELPEPQARYLVHKGSVAVDGVSLTVAAVGDGWFEVALIPHTLEATLFGRREPGEAVNLEVDVIAKYVERMLGERGLEERQPEAAS